MKRIFSVVQLFNSGPKGKGHSLTYKQREHELGDADLDVETIHPFGWPWNPFHNRHNAYRGLDPLRSIWVLLKKRNADLICAHLESAFVILLLRRLFAFRVPVLIWEVPWSPGWRYREFLSRFAIPRADNCVVFSTNQQELIHEKFGDKIAVTFVPFCVDTNFYRPQPAPTNGDKYVWSCGLDEGRDFASLLEASKGLNVTFRIRAAKKLGISHTEHPNVIEEHVFLPAEEFRAKYANASIVVISTKNTPNASGVTSLMESLSMGRPTIVTDNPALRDYFPPDDAILKVPVGDANALRKSISFLLENPALADAMGKKARAFAELRLSRSHHYGEMANAFRSTIANSTARHNEE